MRPIYALAFFASAVSAFFNSWRMRLCRLGLLSSRIPQFILDLKHEYIVTNLEALEGHPNPKEALCQQASPLRESLPSNFPDDLFKNLSVAPPWDSKQWPHARKTLSEMMDCPAALENCENIYVNIQRRNCECHRPWLPEPEVPPRDVPNLLADVLGSMPKLKSIEWRGPEERNAAMEFERLLSERQLSLPSVTMMRLAPNYLFLSTMAPKLETLLPCDGSRTLERIPGIPLLGDIFKATGSLQNLKELTLDVHWDEDLLQRVHAAAPKLEKLGMHGIVAKVDFYTMLMGHDSSGRWSSGFEGEILTNLVGTLNSFENLKTLELPHALNLGMHAIPGSWCGEAYFGSWGTKRRRREILENLAATERASKIVVHGLLNLETLCIGSYCVNCEEGEKLRWPWTGRLREYLLEVRPRWTAERNHNEPYDIEDSDGPILDTWEEDKKWLSEEQEPGEIGISDENVTTTLK